MGLSLGICQSEAQRGGASCSAAEAKETLILGIEVESETNTVCLPLCEDFYFSLNRVILNLPEERSVTLALF